jgi:hypothetical protein
MADPIQPTKVVTDGPVTSGTPEVSPAPAKKIDVKTVTLWLAFAASIANLVLYFVGGGQGPMPPIPVIPQQVAPPPAELNPVVSFGWVNDPAAIKASVERNTPMVFAATPAGKAAQSADADVYLWRAVRKAAGKGETANWYPNVNQKDVGCCVGCGWKHATDVCAAVQVANGRAEEWKPVSVEVIYGGSRVEVGGGQIQGDGSLGAWANEWVSKKGGVAEMRKYDSADLSAFDPNRARSFGRSGVPADIEAEAKTHPVKGTALVKTWQDVDRAIRQGYPVAVCSDQGFTMTRDAQGFGIPQGQWAHCMSFIAVRGGSRPGAFCLNSWGDTAHTGPKYPADMPVAGFWVDAKTVEKMVGMGDSYALADLQGFPARKLDWFADARPAKFRLGGCDCDPPCGCAGPVCRCPVSLFAAR